MLLFLLIVSSSSAQAQASEKPSLEGHWEGSIKVPAMELKVNLNFKAEPGGAWKGDISIPSQGLKDARLIEVSVDDSGKAKFQIENIPGTPTFEGKFSADATKLEGDFHQAGLTFPFTLAKGESSAADTKRALEGFDAFVEGALKSWKVPGLGLAIVKDGEVVLLKGYGLRDVAGKVPVTANTAFAIGSCTKAFTTFVMATLVAEGKLDWDKPVRDFLPGFRMKDPVVTDLLTPRDMTSHRSGLPRHDLMWYNSTFTRKDMVERLKYLDLSEPIRAKFQYNNLMFLTSGYLIEHLTGQSWEDAVRSRVFEPLTMKSSVFSIADVKKLADYALPYDEREDVVQVIPFREIANIGPAGSISSTPEDMSRWVRMLLGRGKTESGKALAGPAGVAELFQPQMVMGAPSTKPELSDPVYALGWMVDSYRGRKRVHHGGNIDGFSAETTLFPDDAIGVVALANMNGSPLPGLIARHAADRLLKLSAVDWNAEALGKRDLAKKAEKAAKAKKGSVKKQGTSPSHKIEEYAGAYEHPGYGGLVISFKEGKLGLKFNSIEAPLEHWHYDTFNCGKNPADPAFEDMKVQFHTNTKGVIDAVEAPFEPSVKPIRFERLPDAKLKDPEYLKAFVGEYELSGAVVKIELKGSVLTFQAAGQPSSELVPDPDGDFHLKIASMITVHFVVDASGKTTSAEVNQPNGVFTAAKKEPKK